MTNQAVLDFAERARASKDPFAEFHRFFRDRGGQGLFYSFAPIQPPADGQSYSQNFTRHSYGHEWESTFGLDSLGTDISYQLICAGVEYFDWRPENLSHELEALTPEQRVQFEIEEEFGMVHGRSLRLSSERPGLSGIGLWYETQKTDDGFRNAWARFGSEIESAAHVMDTILRRERPNLMVGLTPREKDCLDWLVQGLRPAEICFRLRISEKTFEKHISSAKHKLRARTRDQAVAKALAAGLLLD